jgi:hypothetical protein
LIAEEQAHEQLKRLGKKQKEQQAGRILSSRQNQSPHSMALSIDSPIGNAMHSDRLEGVHVCCCTVDQKLTGCIPLTFWLHATHCSATSLGRQTNAVCNKKQLSGGIPGAKPELKAIVELWMLVDAAGGRRLTSSKSLASTG